MILTMPGGYREGAGRKSAFPGKLIEKPFAMDFTPNGRRVLEGLTTRHGLSRNDVIAHLALKYADRLVFEEEGVVFPGKAQQVLSIRVTPEVAVKLTAVHDRTGKGYSDIGEALVTRFATEREFPVLPGRDPLRRRRRRGRRR